MINLSLSCRTCMRVNRRTRTLITMTIEKIIRKLIRKGHPQGFITTHLIEREVEKNMPDFILFIILFVFWIPLSGQFDIFHLTLGVISCALVSRISGNLLFREKSIRSAYLWEVLRFLKYL